MFSAFVAIVFAGAGGLAVIAIARSFAGGAERIDAIFARHHALEANRVIFGEMKPVVSFTPAPPPNFAPRTIIAMPRRTSVAFQFRAGEWRAAA